MKRGTIRAVTSRSRVAGVVTALCIVGALAACGSGGSNASAGNPSKTAIATVAREQGSCLRHLGLDPTHPERTFTTSSFIVVVVSSNPVADFGVEKKTPDRGSFPADNDTQDTIASC